MEKKKVKVEYEVGEFDSVSMKDIYWHMPNCLGFIVKDNKEEKWEMFNSNCMSIAFGEDLEEEILYGIEEIIFVNENDYVLEITNDYDYEMEEIDNENIFSTREEAIKGILECWKKTSAE